MKNNSTNKSAKQSAINQFHVELDHAVTSFANTIDSIKELLSDAALYNEDVYDEMETIRHLVDDLINACDATEDSFADVCDDLYIDQEDD